MKITLESTDEFSKVANGSGSVAARVWEGTAEDGTPIRAYISAIAVESMDPLANQRLAHALSPAPKRVSVDYVGGIVAALRRTFAA